MRIRRSAILAGCAITVLAVGAPAYAQSPEGAVHGAATYHWDTTDDNPGGDATFTQHGDKLKVCDTDADGWSAIVYVQRSSGFPLYRVEARGRFNCDSISAGTGFNLKEGSTYRFKLCLAHVRYDDRFCNLRKLKA